MQGNNINLYTLGLKSYRKLGEFKHYLIGMFHKVYKFLNTIKQIGNRNLIQLV